MLKYFKLIQRLLLINLYRMFGIPFIMPYKYIFLITNVCQSRCLTCNIWKIYQNNPKLIKNELKLEDYEKIFESVKNDVFWLNFSGGEPFLREDLVELTQLAFKKFKNLIIFNIPTNGLETNLIKKRVEEILKLKRDDIKFFVTISLDGPEQINDKIRGVKGSYKKAKKTYKILRKFTKKYKNFFVNFQTTLSKYNIENYKEILKEIKDSEMPIITFSFENKYFNNLGIGVGAQEIDREKILTSIKYFYENYPTSNILNLIPKLYLKLAKKFFKNPNKLPLPCYASFATTTIDSYGNIFSCAYFFEKIDNLKKFDFDIKKILHSKRAEILKNKIKGGNCPRCWSNCEAYPSMINFFIL